MKPIRLRDMKPGFFYRVVTGGSTLRVDDRVWLESDTCMMCAGVGWLKPEHWGRLKNFVVIDEEYYEKELAELRAEVEEVRKILKEARE